MISLRRMHSLFANDSTTISLSLKRSACCAHSPRAATSRPSKAFCLAAVARAASFTLETSMFHLLSRTFVSTFCAVPTAVLLVACGGGDDAAPADVATTALAPKVSCEALQGQTYANVNVVSAVA